MPNFSKIKIFVAGGAFFAAFLIGGLLVTSRLATDEQTINANQVPVLTQVQALGQLHTARFNYESSGNFEAWRKPADLVAFIPGASSVVHWATSNNLVASYRGSIEAGVDLTKTKEITEVQSGKLVRILVIPAAQLYAPEASANVDSIRFKRFWQDDNLVPNAIASVENQYRAASLQQGILAVAAKNAQQKLHTFLASIGEKDLQIRVASQA